MFRKLSLSFLLLIISYVVRADSTDAKLYIRSVILKGNKVTRSQVILRELSFKAGDSISLNELDFILKEDTRKLQNTLLFNEVQINSFFVGESDVADIEIEMIERWYIWPSIIFEFADRNFNQWYLTKDLSRTNIGLMVQHKIFWD